MSNGITLHILGDFGPFSRIGKSIGYQVEVGSSNYLVDCGAPLFQQIGGHGLQKIKGLFITHAHEDHKRWFTDLALFNMYARDIEGKVSFFTSEDIHEDVMNSSRSALDRSLSVDSKRIVDIPYEDYVDFRIIGPRARYRIVSVEDRPGSSRLAVLDSKGSEAGHGIAKIVVNPATKRPRMLFKDPASGEWIEPESYYPFSSNIFYEEDKNIYRDPEGFFIEAIKAPVWHGVPAIGIKISTGADTLIFSSDTVNNRGIWEELYKEKIVQNLRMSREEFEAASIIEGDINDYIERMWSEERFHEALSSFNCGVVVHDITIGAGAVHTEYHKLDKAFIDKEKTILTHSPDRITSEWVLSNADKYFMIKGESFHEIVGNDLKEMNADIYHKEAGKYYVGYKNNTGRFTVYDNKGILRISANEEAELGTPIYKVDMYEDISGKYYPMLDNVNNRYWEGTDGRVEMISLTEDGSTGKLVQDHRDRLSEKG
ncbi:MAG: hypothetical protein Q7U10_10290 [Thermodesulfovibrionia bacterium]|nr:hypothetical protein [Thermodesulfovibrionia bacterium]